MNFDVFSKAVNEMVGLPPVMRDQLITLGVTLTDEERKNVIAELNPLHDDIITAGKEVIDEANEGMKEVDVFRHKDLPKLHEASEQEDRNRADTIFNDDSPTAAA